MDLVFDYGSINYNNKAYKLNFIDVCAHGYLQVPRLFIKFLTDKMNVKLKISQYSYMDKDYAYLEEDCDATALYETCDNLGLNLRDYVKNEYSEEMYDIIHSMKTFRNNFKLD